MGRRDVVRNGLIAVGMIAGSAAQAQFFTAPVAVFDLAHELSATQSAPATPNSAAPPATAPSIGNPLWSIPLDRLTASRTRPLFAPTRRPPAPLVPAAPPAPVTAAPKPVEAEKLQLSLVGTVVGEGGGRIGLFVNAVDKNALRLKVGDEHAGWILRDLLPYRALLSKGQQSALLELARRDSKSGSPPAAAPAGRAGQAGGGGAAGPPAQSNGGFAPRRDAPAVVPITIVQPPPPAPQINPFEKAWSGNPARK
jgi:general secretion pathway protein N